MHIVVERRSKNKDDAVNQWKEAIFGAQWVSVYATDAMPWPRPKIAQRDYRFFGEIANVRGKGVLPRGLPEDISFLTRQEFEKAASDYHSASHLTIKEFSDAWFKVHPKQKEVGSAYTKEGPYDAADLMGIWEHTNYDYRVVFWFDN